MNTGKASAGTGGEQPGGDQAKPEPPGQLSDTCTKEVMREAKLRDLLYIVAYSANGKGELVLAHGAQEKPLECDPSKLKKEHEVQGGYCDDGKPRPHETCRWVNVGGVYRWICA